MIPLFSFMGLNNKKPTITIKTIFKHGYMEWIDGDDVEGTGPVGTTTVGGVETVGGVGTVVGAVVAGAVVLCVHARRQSVIIIYYKKVNKIICGMIKATLEFLEV